MKNVLGTTLQLCSRSPLTGYHRDGFCKTDNNDKGRHVIASIMTEKLLAYTRSKGNDLSTPNVLYSFPGLKENDRWCLCALRWKEAYEAGYAPPVVLEATHEKALEFVDLEILIEHSVRPESTS